MKLINRLKNYPGKWKRMLDLAPLADDLHDAWQGREDQPLTNQERQLLENTLALGAVTADDICVPRADIVAISQEETLAEILKVFGDTTYSRLPVYGRDMDDIKGYLSLKDILPHLMDTRGEFVLKEHIRPVPFVPETMPVPRILNQMKRHKASLVMVLDEFGGVSGLVVLKDILEELVGPLEDEHEDHQAEENVQDMVETGAGVWRVRGSVLLDDLEETLKLEVPQDLDDDVGTLAGWLQVVTQRIPQKGEKILLGNNLFATVLAANPRQVLWVEIQKK